MSFHALVYHSILAIGIVLCVGLGRYAWHRRERRIAKLLAGTFATLVYWMVTTSLVIHFAGSPLVKPIARLQYVAITVNMVFLLLLALQYTGRERYISRRLVALLLVHPVLTNVAVWAPPLKDQFLAFGAREASSFFGYTYSAGPLFQIHTAYSYLVTTVVTLLFVSFAFRSDELYQRQIVAIVIAVLAPFVGNVLFLSGLVNVDITSLAFAVTGVALWWAIFAEDFLDVVPVARSTVVDNIGAGVFVLDRENNVVDINPTGREMLGLEDADIIGQDASVLLASQPAVRERFERVDGDEREIDTEVAFGSDIFRVQISPLYDKRDTLVGRLFLVNDITEQKHRQRELERQNEHLEQFANVVSHDLRNPLNVAAGKVELGLETDERRHFEEAQDAHGRMSRIIDDVLTLAREGKQVDEFTRVSLRTLAESAWEHVETPEATLRVTDDHEFEADEQRLLRAFENLFRNAIEHGHTDATVEVSPTPEGFAIADDGPGIPEDQRDDVFEDGFTTNEQGTGFGLSIVHSIVEAHGWQITVTESTDGGARFDITGVPPLADQRPPENRRSDVPSSTPQD